MYVVRTLEDLEKMTGKEKVVQIIYQNLDVNLNYLLPIGIEELHLFQNGFKQFQNQINLDFLPESLKSLSIICDKLDRDLSFFKNLPMSLTQLTLDIQRPFDDIIEISPNIKSLYVDDYFIFLKMNDSVEKLIITRYKNFPRDKLNCPKEFELTVRKKKLREEIMKLKPRVKEVLFI